MGGLINTKRGRKKKEFKPELFEKLCRYHSPQKEIADIFSMTAETLRTRVFEHYERPYHEVAAEFQAEGKGHLRMWQFDKAAKGSDRMLIFLGKQILGQTDKMEQINKTEITINDKPLDENSYTEIINELINEGLTLEEIASEMNIDLDELKLKLAEEAQFEEMERQNE